MSGTPFFDGHQAPSTDNIQSADLTCLIDWSGGTNPIYIGFALPGSATSADVWQIRKLTWDGSNNPTAIQLADGSSNYNAIWDNRAALTYS